MPQRQSGSLPAQDAGLERGSKESNPGLQVWNLFGHHNLYPKCHRGFKAFVTTGRSTHDSLSSTPTLTPNPHRSAPGAARRLVILNSGNGNRTAFLPGSCPGMLALHHTGEPTAGIEPALLAYEASTPPFVFRWHNMPTVSKRCQVLVLRQSLTSWRSVLVAIS
jgi:hypothetical protein